MSIEYHPPFLGQIFKERNVRRLRNRDGQAIAISPDNGEVVWAAEGSVLDVNAQAVEFDQQHPDYLVKVIEQTCGSTVVMGALPPLRANLSQISTASQSER